MTTKEELIKIYSEKLSSIKDENVKLSDKSIKVYVMNIMKLAKDMNKPLEVETFLNFKEVKQFIANNNKVLTTQKNKVNAVVVYLKAYEKGDYEVVKEYGEWVVQLRNKIDDDMGQNEKSVKEEENWMSIEELEKELAKLKEGLLIADKKPTYDQLLSYQRYFMLAFHIQYPLRNDLANCLIGADPYSAGPENYIRIRPYLKTAGMVMTDYKTSDTYGRIEFEIVGEALSAVQLYYALLKKFLAKNGKLPLIVDKDGTAITRNNYTKHFQAIFKDSGKSVSTTLIRKAVVSSVYDTKKIKELARVMGHSPEMALNIYAKDM
jgi:hypothetical protein